jgi:hypothetical protein
LPLCETRGVDSPGRNPRARRMDLFMRSVWNGICGTAANPIDAP